MASFVESVSGVAMNCPMCGSPDVGVLENCLTGGRFVRCNCCGAATGEMHSHTAEYVWAGMNEKSSLPSGCVRCPKCEDGFCSLDGEKHNYGTWFKNNAPAECLLRKLDDYLTSGEVYLIPNE